MGPREAGLLASGVRKTIGHARQVLNRRRPSVGDVLIQLSKTMAEQDRRISELEAKIGRTEQRDEKPSAEFVAIARWLREHPEVVKKHLGKTVAIHPTEGIVASGNSYGEVVAEVRRLGYERKVVIDYIRSGVRRPSSSP